MRFLTEIELMRMQRESDEREALRAAEAQADAAGPRVRIRHRQTGAVLDATEARASALVSSGAYEFLTSSCLEGWSDGKEEE